MTLVRRPSPFGELLTIRQAMDRLFDDNGFRPFAGLGGLDLGGLDLGGPRPVTPERLATLVDAAARPATPTAIAPATAPSAKG